MIRRLTFSHSGQARKRGKLTFCHDETGRKALQTADERRRKGSPSTQDMCLNRRARQARNEIPHSQRNGGRRNLAQPGTFWPRHCPAAADPLRAGTQVVEP